jgi:CheY-like chemotaxis protein
MALIYPDLAIIMISAYDDRNGAATALERGADKFLTKPVPQLKLDVAAVIAGAQGAP